MTFIENKGGNRIEIKQKPKPTRILDSEYDGTTKIKENLELKSHDFDNLINIKEAATPPLETVRITEKNDDNIAEDSVSKPEETLKERLDRVNKLSNNSDTGLNSNVTQSGQMTNVNGAEAEASSAATTSGASTSVVSSSAALTSGVTILSVAAVAVTIGGSIFTAAPTIGLPKVELGTNFISYQIDVSDLAKGYEYVIRVKYNNKTIAEHPIVEEGLQQEIVTGLLPNNEYQIVIVGKGDEIIGEWNYKTITASTNDEQLPKASFLMKPEPNYEDGIFNLSYDVYISDYYHISDNSYVEIYTNDVLVKKESEKDKEGFVRGRLENLSNNTKVSAIAYAVIKNRINGEEAVEIGRYEETTKYPDDFIPTEKRYKSNYTFNENSISSSFDVSRGRILNINTGFDNSFDNSESYLVNVYDNNDNLIMKPIHSNEKELELEINPIYNDIKIEFVELRRLMTEEKALYIDDNGIEYEEFNKKVLEYTFEPLSNEISLNVYDMGYSLNMLLNSEILDSNLEYMVKVVETYSDDSTKTQDLKPFNGLEFADEYQINLDSTNKLELKALEISVLHDDKELIKNKVDIENIEADFKDISIDENGNVIIPYEISLNKDDIEYMNYSIYNGASIYDIELEDVTGDIIIETLNNNKIEGNIDITRNVGGVRLTTSINIQKELEVNIDTEGFFLYENSGYEYYNVAFDVTIDGKNVNCDLPITYEALDGIEVISNAKRYGKYYRFNVHSEFDQSTGDNYRYVKYYIDGFGYNNQEFLIDNLAGSSYDFGSSDYDTFQAGYTLNGNAYVNYFKTENEDGTVNYYFDTEFESDKHVSRLEYSYVKDGNTYYKYTDYSNTKNLVIENIEDYEYDFKYFVYYIYNNFYYSVDPLYQRSYYIPVVPGYDTLNLEGSFIYNNKEDNYTLINVKFLNQYLNPDTKPVIYYNDKEYEIDLEKASYEGAGYLYDIYKLEDDNSTTISLYITGDISESIAKVKYNVIYNDVTNKFTNVTNISTLKLEKEVDLGIYTGKYDVDKFEFTNNDYDWYNYIYIETPFENKDTKDTLRVLAYSDDKVVAEGYLAYGRIEVNVPMAYSDVTLVLEELKQISYQNNNYNIVYKSTELKSYQFDKKEFVENVEISFNETGYGGYITYNQEMSDMSYKIHEYDSNGTLIRTVDASDNSGSFEVVDMMKNDIDKIKSIKIEIIKANWNSSYTIEEVNIDFDITLGDYELSADGEVVVPYKITLPDGAALTDGVIYYTNEESIESLEGTLIYPELDSYIINAKFEVVYTIGNKTIRYSKNISKELDFELDYDYELLSYQVSSYKYNQMDNYKDSNDKDIKYKPGDSNLFYYYHDDTDNKDYYQTEDGQIRYNYEYDDQTGYETFTDSDSNTVDLYDVLIGHNNIFYIEGKLVGVIGNNRFIIDDNYQIEGINTAGILNNLEDIDFEGYDFTVNHELNVNTSSLDSLPKIGFVHSDSTYDLSKVDLGRVYILSKATVEFNVTYKGKTINKEYNYTETNKANISTTSCFTNYSETNTEASVVKNSDDTISFTVATGYESPGDEYYYKLYLRDKVTNELVYESDYSQQENFAVNNVENKAYLIYINMYLKTDDMYLSLGGAVYGKNLNYPLKYNPYIEYDSTNSRFELAYKLKKDKLDLENVVIKIGDTNYNVNLDTATYDQLPTGYTININDVNDTEVDLTIISTGERSSLYSSITLTYNDSVRTYTIDE